MKNKKILIGLVILIVLAISLVILAWFKYPIKTAEVSISTDKTQYRSGDSLKVRIQNNLRKNICFSSCYPYYLEKKDGDFQSYSYSDCQEPNLSDLCVSPLQSKFFEIDLSLLEAGLHRLALPVCLGCQSKESFREDKRFYSNEFTIIKD